MRWLLMPLVMALGGCATYGDWVGQMEQRIARQDPQAALQVLDQRSGTRGKDAALYYLNRGMLLRMQGDLEGSSAAFEQAKVAIDALTAVSVSEQAGALAVSDVRRSYVGDPYERAYLHVYAALNYLELGEPDKARVEMLQLDVLLQGLERDRQFTGTALPRYLSGMIFEARGEWSDAMIAYRKAREAYRGYPAELGMAAPRSLGEDLARAAARLGLTAELEQYRAEFDLPAAAPGARSGQAELIFLLHSGLAPLKRESGIAAPTPAGRIISVSMPYYQSRRPAITAALVSSDGVRARTTLVEDIDAAAREALDRQRGAILARTVARATVKHEATRRAGQENELVGLVVNIAGLVTERADTRSWSTLPNRIYLARVPVEAGPRGVRVELVDRAGGVQEVIEYEFDLEPGEKRFVSLHRVTARDLPALRAAEK